jgi:hypothetical protein
MFGNGEESFSCPDRTGNRMRDPVSGCQLQKSSWFPLPFCLEFTPYSPDNGPSLSLLLLLTASGTFPSRESRLFFFQLSHGNFCTFPLRLNPMKIRRSSLLLMMSSTSFCLVSSVLPPHLPFKASITAHHRPATHERTSRHDRPCQREVNN